jgi:hypothetical protein
MSVRQLSEFIDLYVMYLCLLKGEPAAVGGSAVQAQQTTDHVLEPGERRCTRARIRSGKAKGL